MCMTLSTRKSLVAILAILVLGACSRDHKGSRDTSAVEADAGDDIDPSDEEGGSGDSDDEPDAGARDNQRDGGAETDGGSGRDGASPSQDGASASDSGGAAEAGGDAGTAANDAGAARDASGQRGVNCPISAGESEQCTTPGEVCCPGRGCQKADKNCPRSVSLACDGPEDCSGAQVCCATADGLACAAQCEVKVCRDDADCTGEVCVRVLEDQPGLCIPDLLGDAGIGLPFGDGGLPFPFFDGGFPF